MMDSLAMLRRLSLVTALLTALVAWPALANYQAKDGLGNPFNIKALDLGGSPAVELPQSTPSDATGAAYSATNPLPIGVPDARGSVSINSSALNTAATVNLNYGEGVTEFTVTGLTAAGATLAVESSGDAGTTWNATNALSSGTGTLATTITTDQTFRVNTGGRTAVRLRVSVIGTGTVTVAYNASSVSSLTALSAPIPAGSNTIGAVTQSGTWNIGAITTLPALAAGSNVIGAVTQSGTWNVGTITTLPALPAGSNIIGALVANQSINLAQVAGATVATGNGTASGALRSAVPSDNSAVPLWGQGATGAAVPANAVYHGVVSSGNLVGLIQADASAAINVSTATTTQIVALTSAQKIYVTSYDVVAGGTGNITFVYGTGSNCGTGTTSLTGAYNLAAQAGIAKGSGHGPVLVVPAGNALCVTTSAAVQMSGSVSYTKF